MIRTLKRTVIGTAVGAALGVLPGLVTSHVPFLFIGYAYDTLLIYLGLLIGAAAGSVVGTILTALDAVQGGAEAGSRSLARAGSR
jgi:ABC-type transport system involved in cytochrome c biogenesis permease component